MCHAPGVTVVAVLPSAGPVPPPMRVVTPEARASWISSGQMKWTWVSTPPAVRIRPLPEMTSVLGPTTKLTGVTGTGIALPIVVRFGISNLLLGIGSIVSGLYALPMAANLPSRMPMSALTTPHQSRVSAPVMTVSTGLWSVASPLLFLPSLARCDIPIDSRITLPPPKSISLPLYEGPPLQSASISNVRSVSASRTRSRVVGPYSAV